MISHPGFQSTLHTRATWKSKLDLAMHECTVGIAVKLDLAYYKRYMRVLLILMDARTRLFLKEYLRLHKGQLFFYCVLVQALRNRPHIS